MEQYLWVGLIIRLWRIHYTTPSGCTTSQTILLYGSEFYVTVPLLVLTRIFILHPRCINAHWVRSSARSEMKLKLRRRSVYIGTIAAILVAVAGFAIAGAALTFIGSTGFNTGTQTIGDTIYAGSVGGTMSVQTIVPGSGSCGAGPHYTDTTGTGTDTVDVSDTGAVCSAAGAGGELYDELVFSASGLTSGDHYTDTFSFATTPASAGGTIILTFTTTPAATTETLTVWVDLGAASGNAVTAVNVGIAGN